MSDLSTPLAQQIAAITAAIRTEADHHANRAGLVASLHALIFAALSRLFSRLETMLGFWQAGQLPPLAQTPLATPHRHPAPQHAEAPRATRRPNRARPTPHPPALPSHAIPRSARGTRPWHPKPGQTAAATPHARVVRTTMAVAPVFRKIDTSHRMVDLRLKCYIFEINIHNPQLSMAFRLLCDPVRSPSLPFPRSHNPLNSFKPHPWSEKP